jgi:2-phospho-L-lactate guanylyltransferase
MRTAAILPVKRFSAAKQRLARSVREDLRAELAQAMVGDVLCALNECTRVEAMILVTCEHTVAASARSMGAIVVEDTEESGQSAAASLGLAQAIRKGFQRALCVPGDCPTLDPAEIDALLGGGPSAERHRHFGGRAESPAEIAIGDLVDTKARSEVVIVPDRHGTGTNGLLLCPPDAIAPAFGPGSCERHRALAAAAGVACRIERPSSLLLDIDTGDDLAALRSALAGEGVRGTRTRGVLGIDGERAWEASPSAA